MKPRPSSATKPAQVNWKPKGHGAAVQRKPIDDDEPPFTPDPPKKAKPPVAKHAPAPAPSPKKPVPKKVLARKVAPVPEEAEPVKPKTKAPAKAKVKKAADPDKQKEVLLVLRTNESGKTRIVMVLTPDHVDNEGNTVPMLTIRQQYRRGDDPDWLFSKSGVSTPADAEILNKLIAASTRMMRYV